MSTENKTEKPILIFDQECQLCVRFKQGLEFLDKEEKIKKVPLQADWLYDSFPRLDRESCQETVHLVDSEGQIHTGAEVIEFLVKFYPGVRKFAWLVESESGKKAVNFFYDKVNELRDKVKKDCKGCGPRGRGKR